MESDPAQSQVQSMKPCKLNTGDGAEQIEKFSGAMDLFGPLESTGFLVTPAIPATSATYATSATNLIVIVVVAIVTHLIVL